MKPKTRSILVISVANGFGAFGYGLAVPFLAIYLSAYKGVPAGAIGVMLALAMGATAIASAISGEICDTFGRKRVMMVSLVLRAIFAFAMAAAMFVDAHYMWTMFFHYAGSFVGAFFRPASNAWIADNTTQEERVMAFGFMRIGMNLGWCLGPALGGFLAKTSFVLGFNLTGVVFLATVLFVQLYIKESMSKEQRRKSNFVDMVIDLKDRNLARLCTYTFLISMVLSQLVVGLSLHVTVRLGMSEKAVGMLFALQGLAVVLFQYHVGKVISTKMRLTTNLALGSLLYAIGFGSIGFTATFFAIAAGVILSAVGEMFVLPAGHSLASNLAPDNKRGRYLGLYILSNMGGNAAGIFIAGLLMQHISPVHAAGPWIVVGLLGLMAGVLFYNMRGGLTPHQDGLHPPVPIVKQIPS